MLKIQELFLSLKDQREPGLWSASLNDLNTCQNESKKNSNAASARPQLSMALADPAAGVTEFSRTDKLCLFKSCPVCLCVCVFHYNCPKHSPFLLCNWSITFWEAECMIFHARERGREKRPQCSHSVPSWERLFLDVSTYCEVTGGRWFHPRS